MNKAPKTPEDLDFEACTKDTTAELALYFNLAVERMNNLIGRYENKEIHLEEEYFWNNFDGFSTTTYIYLQHYLWKEPISKHIAIIKPNTIALINQMLRKLVQLRHYHSHFYHDNSVLQFPKELQEFVYTQLQMVINQLYTKHENIQDYLEQLNKDEVEFEKKGRKSTDTYHHFQYFDKHDYITEEGKNFLLSFFLLKGEMGKFLKKRKRCKRDNGEKYQVKNKVLTALCHRDGSNRYFLSAKEEYLDENERLKRQFNTLRNYLLSQPVSDIDYMPPSNPIVLSSREDIKIRKEERDNETEASTDEIPQETVRRKDKFLELAVRYLMDRKKLQLPDSQAIYWHVEAKDLVEVEKQQASQITDPNKKTYYRTMPVWHQEYVPGYFPVFLNRHIKFKLDLDGPEYAIGEREIKNMLFYLLSNTHRKTMQQVVQVLKEYGTQFQAAMYELAMNQTISFTQYPMVFGENGDNHTILSAMHESILNKQNFDLEAYRARIGKAVNAESKKLEEDLKKDFYTRHKKNRILIDCFNWYLPLEAKLKPEEINKLSIYNFVSDNKVLSLKTRASIVAEIKYKLDKAKEGAFAILETATSLDQAYIDMVNKKRQSLADMITHLDGATVTELHELATKLGVSMMGIDQSRKDNNRMDELVATILNKPILVTNGLFKRAFEPANSENISTRLAKNEVFNNLLVLDNYTLTSQYDFIFEPTRGKKDIDPRILYIVDKHYDAFWKEHKAWIKDPKSGKEKSFSVLVGKFADVIEDQSEETRKQIAKAINLLKGLRETKVKDTLLGQILFHYHNLELPLVGREAKHQPIAELHDSVYTLKVKKQTIILKYKQLDDLATYWDKKKLEKLLDNPNYWGTEKEKELRDKGLDDQQVIGIQMNRVFEDSYYYIHTFLQTEEKVLKTHYKQHLVQLLAASRQKRETGLKRVEPEMLLDKIPEINPTEQDAFIHLRQSAFHADVPEHGLSYEKKKEDLALKAGIENKKKKDRKQYEKPFSEKIKDTKPL